jgi:hypothetical protein
MSEGAAMESSAENTSPREAAASWKGANNPHRQTYAVVGVALNAPTTMADTLAPVTILKPNVLSLRMPKCTV